MATLAKYKTLVDANQDDVLAYQEKVFNFLRTEHTSQKTKEHVDALYVLDIRVVRTLRLLTTDKKLAAEFGTEAEKLCRRCYLLREETKFLYTSLKDDLTRREQIEDNNAKNRIAITLFFIVPAGTFISAVSNGFAKNFINIYGAAAVGLGFSASIFYRPKIVTAFKHATKATVDISQQIRYSIMMGFAGEAVRTGISPVQKLIGKYTHD